MSGGAATREPRRAARAASAPLIQAATRDATEHVVARLRRSGRRLVLPAFWLIALCGLTGFAWQRLPQRWENTALPIVAGALVLVLCVAPMLLWMNRITIITTRRIIVKHGFVVRERNEFLLGQGSEATLRRGPLQLMTGSGNVIVHAGAEGTLILRDVPHARLVHAAVVDLIEHAVPTTGQTTGLRRPPR
jgi:Bacterial PH domain